MTVAPKRKKTADHQTRLQRGTSAVNFAIPVTRTATRLLNVALAITLVSIGAATAQAAHTVRVVVGADAPPLERYAADELVVQFQKIFDDVRLTIGTRPSKEADTNILVGRPETNAQIATALGTEWPEITDQGLVIRRGSTGDRKALIVGGGSPRATLWAVYELGHQLGIRYLFRGDIYPLKKRAFDLGNFDIVMEPELKTRTWRTVNDFAIGPESWGVQEHTKFLKQLAKMKFNSVMLSVYPWQPFVQYEFGGVKKQTAVLWFGEEYPVDGDTVGKKVFDGKTVFNNPDFADADTPDEMLQAGQEHMTGLITAARKLGMTVGLSISPLEFPKEFQSALPGSRIGKGINNLTIVPGSMQGPHDATLKKLVATKIRAYLETYPDLDTLYLTLPEFPEWEQHAEAALKLLQSEGALAGLSLDDLTESAAKRHLIASGERGRQAIRGNLVGLAFLRDLLKDEALLKRADGQTVQLVITGVDPALYPVLDQVVPQGAGTLNFVDYTARRVAENRGLLADVPAGKVSSRLIMTLADDNVGVLPQSAAVSLGTLVTDLKKLGWNGFSTRYWVPAELDSSVYFLSRAAWEKDLSAEASIDELWTTGTDNASAAERLVLAWKHLEHATNLIDQHDLGFAFPVSGMMMKHYTAEPMPEWWAEMTDSYTQYMVELYRAHGAIDGDTKPVLFYYAKRGEYVLEYLAAVKAVREAGIAKEAGDIEQAIEHLATALESTYNCINTLSDVAKDQSDRGLIAVLNAYAYRPLLAELDRLSELE